MLNSEEFVISLDIGTTHIKAFAYSTNGDIRASAQAQISDNNDGTQDAVQIFFQCIDLLKIIASQLKNLGIQAKCLSISAAMHSIMPVDARGNPLAAAMIWSNNSGQNIAKFLNNQPLGFSIYSETGTPVHPMSPMIKIAWMKAGQAELFSKASKFISIKEYVYYRLTGLFLIDFSIASATGLFNSSILSWSNLALDFAGIDATQLSAPVSPYHQQEIKTALCYELGFHKKFIIVIGGSDGCLAALGASPLKQGNISLSIGTSAAIRSYVSSLVPDQKGRTFTYLLDEENFITGGPSNSAGAVFTWLIQLFNNKTLNTASFSALNTLAAGISPGADGLSFIPYIFGERAPIWDAQASGSFSGVRNIHKQAHFARAVMEGILFNLRYILEIMQERIKVNDIFAGGGLIAFHLWRSTLATILNQPLYHQAEKEDSAAGAALIGFKSTGILNSITDQSIFYTQAHQVEPDLELVTQYEDLYQQFKLKVNQL